MRGSGLFQGKETSRAKAKAWPSNKASEFVYIIWAKLDRHPGLGGPWRMSSLETRLTMAT